MGKLSRCERARVHTHVCMWGVGVGVAVGVGLMRDWHHACRMRVRMQTHGCTHARAQVLGVAAQVCLYVMTVDNPVWVSARGAAGSAWVGGCEREVQCVHACTPSLASPPAIADSPPPDPLATATHPPRSARTLRAACSWSSAAPRLASKSSC